MKGHQNGKNKMLNVDETSGSGIEMRKTFKQFVWGILGGNGCVRFIVKFNKIKLKCSFCLSVYKTNRMLKSIDAYQIWSISNIALAEAPPSSTTTQQHTYENLNIKYSLCELSLLLFDIEQLRSVFSHRLL